MSNIASLTNAAGVTTEYGSLNAAITAADDDTLASGQSSATDTLTLLGNVTETGDMTAINLAKGVSLVVEGAGDTIDGAHQYSGLFVYSGVVTIKDLTLLDTRSVGGAGGPAGLDTPLGSPGIAGGGGAGLGGGLFVAGSKDPGQATVPNVTLSNVIFSGDSATGGAGGSITAASPNTFGGGGGMLGGAGSYGGGGIGGSGGGYDVDQTGINESGTPGLVPNAAAGGAGGAGAGGASGGGGGGGRGYYSGGFGGVARATSGSGGGGGIGGSTEVNGGKGGFGGGGASHGLASGTGGFGGGGAGVGPAGFGGGGAVPGYGGGKTGLNSYGFDTGGGGGGGLGAGGDIFVQAGATLNIEGGSDLGAGAVAGGQGGTGATPALNGTAGSAYGSGIFLDASAITLGAGQAAGTVTTISGVIANYASGSLTVSGLGTVDLAPVTSQGAATANTFTGGVTIDSGVLELASSQAAGTGTIAFASSAHGELKIAGATLPTNLITGFAAGDSIDFAGIAFSGGKASVASSKLSFTENGVTYKLTFNTSDATKLNAQSDNSGGTLITVACYCRGTRIETEHGPVAVEALAIGDRLVTLSGALRPIKWIGRRSYDGRFVAGSRDILPIRVRQGALADNIPARDLLISPHHALYLEGVLIEARDLVNGVSITQAEAVERVDYFHVELESHDVILAEGAPAETFVDEGSRAMFQNAGDYFKLYPSKGVRKRRPFAPRRDEGFEIEAARQKTAARAGIVPSNAAPGALRGWIEDVTAETLRGWAWDEGAAPVCLHVLADGLVIGRVLANRHRADLERAGLGDGRCAFQFQAPKGVDLTRARIHLRREGDAALLGGSAQDIGARLTA